MITSLLLHTFAPLLRFLPVRVASSLFYRLFSSRCHEFPEKFRLAPLRYAPQVRMLLKVGDAAHSPIAFVGIYEQDLTKKIWLLARTKGGVLLDVGANYGYFSLLWCAAGPKNSAVAVEASPRNLDGLRHNIDSNGFTDRIQVLPWAASHQKGEVKFDLGPPEQTGWGGITQKQNEHVVTVPCYRLDEQVGDRSFAVLKIDCEGADALVIEGAANLLGTGQIRDVFYEECFGRSQELGLRPGGAKSMLEDHGYCVKEFGGANSSEFHAFLTDLKNP